MPELPSNLKTIWFEGEMLPAWAQMLDFAARLCPVPEQSRIWFAQLSNSSGVDDARNISINAGMLRRSLIENKDAVVRELERMPGDAQAPQIFAAWIYALDTMLQQAAAKKTCSWKVEGAQDTGEGDFGDGDISLRRV
jgi:hypothetical protein